MPVFLYILPHALLDQNLSVGLFLFELFPFWEIVGFTLSVSVVEELRPHWLFLFRS